MPASPSFSDIDPAVIFPSARRTSSASKSSAIPPKSSSRSSKKPRFTSTAHTSAESMIGLAESLGLPAERDRMAAAILALSGGHTGAAINELWALQKNIDSVLEFAVSQYREQGRTWADIARLLRVSPQAAHKRFRHVTQS